MAAPQPAMKKRQVIANSNKVMFLWIAGMSAIVGVCIVLSVFLVQQIIFKTKVTNKLDGTASILKDNEKTSESLIQNVRLLETNTALNSIKARPDDKALQVILDALPADQNSLALGSSLQQSLLSGASGITVESLAVQSPLDSTESSDTSVNTIPFTLTVSSGDATSLKDMLKRLESSIRVLDIDSLTLERSLLKYTMILEAHAYFEPAKTVKLTDEVVKP